MKVWQNNALKKYQLRIHEDKMEARLSKYLPTVKDLITFMSKEENLIVSPLNGRIILLFDSHQQKQPIEFILSLTLIYTEDFQQFMKEIRHFKANMDAFKEEFSKRQWEGKIKWKWEKHQGEYEGEISDGKP